MDKVTIVSILGCMLVFAALSSAAANGASDKGMGKRISLEDIGLLQVATHDLVKVDRNKSNHKHIVDEENGKLDLSTILDNCIFPNNAGCEFRNRTNPMVFTVASQLGNTYRNYIDEGLSEEEARQKTIEEYHNRLEKAFHHAFNEPFPAPMEGEVTLTENLAYRTLHDFIPQEIKVDGEIKHLLFDLFNPFSPTTLSQSELKQKSSELDGQYDPDLSFLLDRDRSFSEQFRLDVSIDDFLMELEDGKYDKDDEVMKQIRSLYAKGLNLN